MGGIVMYRRTCFWISALLLFVFFGAPVTSAADQPIAIFHAFDQNYNDVNGFVCKLADQGYSHIQIAPAQRSNPKEPNEWYFRYQPVEYGKIEGRGSEDDLKRLIDKANSCGFKVIADIVFNHMASISDFNFSDFSEFNDKKYFHDRCSIVYNDNNRDKELICWIGDLPDLNQSIDHVRDVHKAHLKKLLDLGIGGFRFDAAKHMPHDIVKEYIKFIDDNSNGNAWNYLEVIDDNDTKAEDYNDIAAVEDFKLYRSMKSGFELSGDLRTFPPEAVPDSRSVTFGENHDTINYLKSASGLLFHKDAISPHDDRSDAQLASAFVLARESGTPLIFNEDNLIPYIPTGVRFRRIMHDRGKEGRNVKENILKLIDSPTMLVMERGSEGFLVLNKATEKFDTPELDLTLTNLEGCYRELRGNFTVAVEKRGDKKYVTRWGAPSRGGMEVFGRDALYFTREPFDQCQ
jgi:alpha-amylase